MSTYPGHWWREGWRVSGPEECILGTSPYTWRDASDINGTREDPLSHQGFLFTQWYDPQGVILPSLNIAKWLGSEPTESQIHSIHHIAVEDALRSDQQEESCCGSEVLNGREVPVGREEGKGEQLLESGAKGFPIRFDERHTLLIDAFPAHGGFQRRYSPPPDQSYHVFDYSCFWFNIRENVGIRVHAWRETQAAKAALS